MRRAFLALTCLLVGPGCATPIEYKPFEVDVEVAVPCAAEKPQAPARATDKLKKADTLDDKARAALADLKRQESYIEKLKASVDGCR